MGYNEYTYRMKPVVIPGVIYLVLMPVSLIIANMYFPLKNFILYTLFGIYSLTALMIFVVWAVAGSRKVIFDEHAIVISDIFSKKVFEPATIQRATFFWTSNKKKEIVKIRTREHSAFFSDLYTPYQLLLTDMENYIYTYNIRTNLRTHTDRAPQRYDGYRDRDGHYRGYAR